MFRAELIVPDRTKQMIQAISQQDFDKFAEITIRDSNQFHAVCQVHIYLQFYTFNTLDLYEIERKTFVEKNSLIHIY